LPYAPKLEQQERERERERWVRDDNRNVYTVFIIKLDGERKYRRYERSITTNQNGTWCEGEGWTRQVATGPHNEDL
jgi:hypothetical protein